MKKTLLISLLFLASCATPHVYDDPINPGNVSLNGLEDHAIFLEKHYQQYAQVEGVIWQPRRTDLSLENPDAYGSGGDSAIFGGYKLAADVFRYVTLGEEENIDKVIQSLRGVYILTHIAGPGVIARCAFPTDQPEKWGFPEFWQGRIDKGFVGTSSADSIRDPFKSTNLRDVYFPEMTYYTRATRDQLTGLLFGLAVAWQHLNEDDWPAKIIELKRIIAQTVEDLYRRLRAHDFMIRDENGRNDTNADDVGGIQKLQLLALYKETVKLTSPERAARIEKKYLDQFCSIRFPIRDIVNVFNNYSQYYSWNLRYARAYTVWLLETDDEREEALREWVENNAWCYTREHQSPFFTYIRASINWLQPPNDDLDDALLALKSLSLKPVRDTGSPLAGDIRGPNPLQVLVGKEVQYVLAPHLRKSTSYFTWTKRPWDVGGGEPGQLGWGDTTGLDFLLPYWMGRYYEFIR